MGMRTVRLELADEKRLERIQRKTGWTASDILKRGVQALDEKLASAPANNAYEAYAKLDLGEGGWALGPASRSREVVREAILKKRRKT